MPMRGHNQGQTVAWVLLNMVKLHLATDLEAALMPLMHVFVPCPGKGTSKGKLQLRTWEAGSEGGGLGVEEAGTCAPSAPIQALVSLKTGSTQAHTDRPSNHALTDCQSLLC